MLSLWNAARSMNRSTSATGMKWRATSSMTPRHANRGWSSIRTAGSSTGEAGKDRRSVHGGSNCRSVCAPWKTASGDPPAMSMPSGAMLSAYEKGARASTRRVTPPNSGGSSPRSQPATPASDGPAVIVPPGGGVNTPARGVATETGRGITVMVRL
jgi:hypothetical protein